MSPTAEAVDRAGGGRVAGGTGRRRPLAAAPLREGLVRIQATTAVATALAAVLWVAFCLTAPAGLDPSAVPRSTNIPSIASLATNCPPISYLLMSYRLGAEAPELCEYRAQPNGLVVRTTRGASLDSGPDLKNTLAGRWDDDYWFYSPAGRQASGEISRSPTLQSYHYVPGDTYSEAYVRVKEYAARLKQYTSLGVASVDSGNLAFDEALNLTHEHPENHIKTTATFQYSNALPVLAQLRIVDSRGKVYTKNRVRYGYSPEIANGKIPASVQGDGFSIEIAAITFEPPGVRLDRGSFMPPQGLTSLASLLQIVYTNRAEYLLREGKAFSIDPVQAARRLREGTPYGARGLPHGYERLFMVMAGLISVLVLVVAMQRARQQRK